MHKSFVKLYVCMLIVWVVEKSECKQGVIDRNEEQQTNAGDFDLYDGAACLSYGHSCWGAHGKRNADLSNSPDARLLYQMALVQKSANKDSSVDRRRSLENYVLNHYDMLKTYLKMNPKKINSDDTMDAWNYQPSKYVSNDRYYEDQLLDPRMEYYNRDYINDEMPPRD